VTLCALVQQMPHGCVVIPHTLVSAQKGPLEESGFGSQQLGPPVDQPLHPPPFTPTHPPRGPYQWECAAADLTDD